VASASASENGNIEMAARRQGGGRNGKREIFGGWRHRRRIASSGVIAERQKA
jgi:hypothetical protein